MLERGGIPFLFVPLPESRFVVPVLDRLIARHEVDTSIVPPLLLLSLVPFVVLNSIYLYYININKINRVCLALWKKNKGQRKFSLRAAAAAAAAAE